jgi:hypothetical protein
MFPPKPPVFTTSRMSPEVKVTPMPLSDRLRRGIMPWQGFCSTIFSTTVSEGLTSGSAHMYFEVTCDPYSEQILFHHESFLVPWKRPLKAPKAAEVFPQVRQMVLDGRYQEAIELAFKEMNKGSIKQNTGSHAPDAWPAQAAGLGCAGDRILIRLSCFQTRLPAIKW